MIRAHREIAARMLRVNKALGEIMLEMLKHQDDEQFTPSDLTDVGRQLVILGEEMMDLGRGVPDTVESG